MIKNAKLVPYENCNLERIAMKINPTAFLGCKYSEMFASTGYISVVAFRDTRIRLEPNFQFVDGQPIRKIVLGSTIRWYFAFGDKERARPSRNSTHHANHSRRASHINIRQFAFSSGGNRSTVRAISKMDAATLRDIRRKFYCPLNFN